MADDKDLRNALDAVNAGRKWTLFGMAALFFAVTITLGFVFSMLIPSMVQAPGAAPEAIGAPPEKSRQLFARRSTGWTACCAGNWPTTARRRIASA